jgi:hypothetical protein
MAGMDERRSNWLGPLLIVVILLTAATSYVVGYFTLGRPALATVIAPSAAQSAAVNMPTRIFRSKWQAILFTPAAKIESALTGEEVEIGWAGRLAVT